MELIENHLLYIPSLSTLATGPVHTFHSIRSATIEDIGNLSLFTVLVSCHIEDHPLNTSDHLPIVSKLNLSLVSSGVPPFYRAPRLDWDSGRSQGCISRYASLADSAVTSLVNKNYDSIKEIEAEITRISCQLGNAAQSSIPPSRHPKALSKRSMTLIYLLCVGVVVLLFVSGRPRVLPDLAHSMTKERNVRKMSECTFPNSKHNYNVKTFKNLTKLFILTILNVSKRPLRNQEEPLSLSTGPQTPTLPVFYLYGLTIPLTSTSRLSNNLPPSRKSGTPSRK